MKRNAVQPGLNPRVLITTSYRHSFNGFYDALGANILYTPRFAFMRTTHPGVRFLKQNVPEIEILEYPLWHDYVRKLKEGWDTVGFSFFHYDIPEIIEMAREARRQGISQIWAGGYGAFSDESHEIADRVFFGYSEDVLNRELFGRKLERLQHPPVISALNLHVPFTIPYKKIGHLFTQRGCPYRCPFCQTPLHCPQPYTLPIESIEEVLKFYRSHGINELWITDETFYLFPSYSEKVIDLLVKYNFHWWVMTRMELVLKHLDSWSERGMAVAAFGVESVHQHVLDSINKSINLDMMYEFRRRTREKKVFTQGAYIIGYETDTVSSVLADYEVLEDLDFDAYQFTILTPEPKVPTSIRIEKLYGIFDRNHHHYTGGDLVWNHPHITPEQMKFLYRIGMAIVSAPRHYLSGIVKTIQRRSREKGFGILWDDVARPFLHSLYFNERKQQFIPQPVSS